MCLWFGRFPSSFFNKWYFAFGMLHLKSLSCDHPLHCIMPIQENGQVIVPFCSPVRRQSAFPIFSTLLIKNLLNLWFWFVFFNDTSLSFLWTNVFFNLCFLFSKYIDYIFQNYFPTFLLLFLLFSHTLLQTAVVTSVFISIKSLVNATNSTFWPRA